MWKNAKEVHYQAPNRYSQRYEAGKINFNPYNSGFVTALVKPIMKTLLYVLLAVSVSGCVATETRTTTEEQPVTPDQPVMMLHEVCELHGQDEQAAEDCEVASEGT